MLPIILASGSKNRRTILEALGFPFRIEVSNFDEQSVEETNFSLRAQQIALGKAQTIAKYPVTTWAAGYALIDEYLFTLASQLHGSLVGLTHGLPTEWLIPLLVKEGYEVKL